MGRLLTESIVLTFRTQAGGRDQGMVPCESLCSSPGECMGVPLITNLLLAPLVTYPTRSGLGFGTIHFFLFHLK